MTVCQRCYPADGRVVVRRLVLAATARAALRVHVHEPEDLLGKSQLLGGNALDSALLHQNSPPNVADLAGRVYRQAICKSLRVAIL